MCSSPKLCGDEYEKASSKTEREMKWKILQRAAIGANTVEFSQQPHCCCYSKLLLIWMMVYHIFWVSFIELNLCVFLHWNQYAWTLWITITVAVRNILHTIIIYFLFALEQKRHIHMICISGTMQPNSN